MMQSSTACHPQACSSSKAGNRPPTPAAAALPCRNHPHYSRGRHTQPHRSLVIAAAHEALQQQPAADPLPALRAWVAKAGGYVDARLAVSDCAPASGCRGIVTTAHISLEDLDATGPLISVPQQLQFTSSTALGIISSAAGAAAAAAAEEQLSDSQLIAAALAHELQASHSSFWQPYLASLPAQPPNPWLLTDPDQVLALAEPYQQQLHAAGATAADWAAATAATRQQQIVAAAEVVCLLGPDLGISQEGVLLALGQVTSRSLASGSSGGMCPVIDLVNHHETAGAPMLQLDDKDQLTMTVLPLKEGEAVPMSAGDELLILYKGGYTPLEAFLKFGFVADEWWQ